VTHLSPGLFGKEAMIVWNGNRPLGQGEFLWGSSSKILSVFSSGSMLTEKTFFLNVWLLCGNIILWETFIVFIIINIFCKIKTFKNSLHFTYLTTTLGMYVL
jgi:hypothetical protein